MATNPPENGNTLMWRVNQLEKDVDILVKKVDRLVWALVMLSISLTSSAIVLAITIGVSK